MDSPAGRHHDSEGGIGLVYQEVFLLIQPAQCVMQVTILIALVITVLRSHIRKMQDQY